MKIVLVIFLLGFTCIWALNNLPIIGILGVPITGGCDVELNSQDVDKFLNSPRISNALKSRPTASSCFTSFYVKWIEMGGARVVPIRYDTPRDELLHLFYSLNGILFTGGGLSLSLNTTYVETALFLYNLATKVSTDYFPIWGTCQGFQLLNVLTALDSSVVVAGFDAEDISWPLTLTSNAYSSNLFSSISKDIVQILSTENVTMNFHHDGVTPETYNSNSRLNSFFNVLSTNKDRKGREFLSTMEAKRYPIYASQWHPERQQFEFETYDVGLNHTLGAIRAMQAVGAFFVNEAKKNDHTFLNKTEEGERLIYNYDAVYQGGSTQFYFF